MIVTGSNCAWEYNLHGDKVRAKNFAIIYEVENFAPTWNKKLIVNTSFQVYFIRKEFVIKRIGTSQYGALFYTENLFCQKILILFLIFCFAKKILSHPHL